MVNTLENILGPRFKPSSTDVYIGEAPFLNKKIWYKTNQITRGEALMSQIYEYCKNDLYGLQQQYKNFFINGVKVTSSSFLLKTIGNYDEKMGKVISKNIYFLQLEEDKTILETKHFLTENLIISAPYKVYIIIELHSNQNQPQEQKPIEENNHIICLSNNC